MPASIKWLGWILILSLFSEEYSFFYNELVPFAVV